MTVPTQNTVPRALLGALSVSLAAAAPLPDPDAITLRPAGVLAFPPPPAGFNPRSASQALLSAYGFPPRPDPVRLATTYADWLASVSAMHRLIPVLQTVPIRHAPLMAAPPAGAANTSVAATSVNWSGYVAPAPAFAFGNQSITAVFGDWMLPVAQTAFNGCHPHGGESVYSSTWVGIDGSGSYDVLQAGTESDAVCAGGVVAPFQTAWYEWFPDYEVRVANLPVSPGDAMYVHVWAKNATRGHVYIANKTTRQSVALMFDAPPGTALIGNSAEWVIERPVVDGQLATLTNYVQEFFAAAQAHDALGTLYTPGAPPPGQPPALQIGMTDNNGDLISVPELQGDTGLWFTAEGSAQHVQKE
jgi:hypothetical protein